MVNWGYGFFLFISKILFQMMVKKKGSKSSGDRYQRTWDFDRLAEMRNRLKFGGRETNLSPEGHSRQLWQKWELLTSTEPWGDSKLRVVIERELQQKGMTLFWRELSVQFWLLKPMFDDTLLSHIFKKKITRMRGRTLILNTSKTNWISNE